MALSDLPLREELVGKDPYGAPQLEVPVALNTNENPYSPSARIIEDLVQAVREEAPQLNRYPERDSVLLREDLAAYITKSTGVEVTKDNLWAANGSNEILQQLLQAFGGAGRCALGFQPSYSMHPILSEGTDTRFVDCPRVGEDFHIDLDAAEASIKEHNPHIIFITTPNNPTGTHTSLEDIRTILDLAPGIVVVDEAYAEFSEEPSAISLLKDYPHKLVVSRTMSKAFDFAGGRLGYFIAHPDFVAAVMLVRLPYHLSVLSQLAARVALRYSEDTLATVDILVQERKRVKAALEDYGYEVVPSHANFLFFKIPESYQDAAELWQGFLDHGVLIRNVGVPGFLRVTIGTPEENDIFLSVAQSLVESP